MKNETPLIHVRTRVRVHRNTSDLYVSGGSSSKRTGNHEVIIFECASKT